MKIISMNNNYIKLVIVIVKLKPKWTKRLARGGIEPTTSALLARRSNQLS